ncbi:Uncharacterised protein [Mycobacteroides abscessus subsp. abscessus]|jgi:hypothetical protein|uniref:hypothetical protein n=1 Tax=Mycobacteroides abscessus TaxID=36809 RepID=UPI000927813B|nr:hypothetical protein [Mycobacteroides abscessus]SIH34243.1 Uncharacterised protein [Mycobacteroides abscessus subsp. abscessus]
MPWKVIVSGLLVTAAILLCGAACDRGIDRAAAPDIETSTSGELVREATEFGGWRLPSGAKVLLAQRETVGAKKYRIAVSMSAVDVQPMLAKSNFTSAFNKLYQTSLVKIIAGPELDTSPNVILAQDNYVPAEGKSAIREVVIDERDPQTRIVHLEFRGV